MESGFFKPTKDSSADVCGSLQLQEWEVLTSIYPEYISGGLAERTIRLRVPVEFDKPQEVIISNLDLTSPMSHEVPQQNSLRLSTLPPILINIIIPLNYPLPSPPTITTLEASESWFQGLDGIFNVLQNMWQPGMEEGVLSRWIECILTGEFIFSHQSWPLNPPSPLRIAHPHPPSLAPLLAAYQKSIETLKFSLNSHSCSICLTAYKGSNCLALSCSHVFCRSCLGDFWKLQIQDGEFEKVACPDPDYMKSGSHVLEEELARVLTDEDLRRWRWLREKRALDKDTFIVYCPMRFCQTPIPKPGDKLGESSNYDLLRSCPTCQFSFCTFCKHAWHGPLNDCPENLTRPFIERYMALPENSPWRSVMETEFGVMRLRNIVQAKHARRLIAQTKSEEERSLDLIADSTVPCPGCRVQIHKLSGCNHMICAKCQQKFCYACGGKLNGDTYVHESGPCRDAIDWGFEEP